MANADTTTQSVATLSHPTIVDLKTAMAMAMEKDPSIFGTRWAVILQEEDAGRVKTAFVGCGDIKGFDYSLKKLISAGLVKRGNDKIIRSLLRKHTSRKDLYALYMLNKGDGKFSFIPITDRITYMLIWNSVGDAVVGDDGAKMVREIAKKMEEKKD